MAETSAEALAGAWTPELRTEFKDWVNQFFDKHPDLRQGTSDALREMWDSPEGRHTAQEMSDAMRS